jgi:translation elongation factor EF-G
MISSHINLYLFFFTRCEIKVSEPIVSFRETIIPFDEVDLNTNTSGVTVLPPPWGDIQGLQKAKRGRVRITVEAQNVAITVKSFPIPVEAANILEQDTSNVNRLDEFLGKIYFKEFLQCSNNSVDNNVNIHKNYVQRFSELEGTSGDDNKSFESTWRSFTENLNIAGYDGPISQALGVSSAAMRTAMEENVITVGPRSCPANFLVFRNDASVDIFDGPLKSSSSSNVTNGNDEVAGSPLVGSIRYANQKGLFFKLWNRLHSAVIAGFNEAVVGGPLMNEPMYGIVYAVEKVEMSKPLVDSVLSFAEKDELFQNFTPTIVDSESNADIEKLSSVHSGQLISEVKENLRIAMLSCPVRIVEPIYQCDLQCDQSQLGNLYAVLSRRRGTVFKEDIIEGTSMFLLSAYLPVAQSFQFAQELLKKTSGSGTAPQLSFSRWQLMEQDPFWRPRTEDELEEFGEQFLDEHNLAKSWITKIRKRKGLPVDEQVVAVAEKQRTLSRKK